MITNGVLKFRSFEVNGVLKLHHHQLRHPHQLHQLITFLLCLLPLSAIGQNGPCRDTLVRVYDSVCEGNTYNFNGRTLTYTGLFFDTLSRFNSDCDSVVILHLTVLESVQTLFHAAPLCKNDIGYLIVSSAYEMPHRHWTSRPIDSTLIGQDGEYQVRVNPTQTTTYTLYTDYRAAPPQCPETGSITVNPIQPVMADMLCTPNKLDLDHTELTIEDYSIGNRDTPYGGWAGRHWYINGIEQTNDNPVVTIDVPPDMGDSTEIMLLAYTPTCLDTAIEIIPFHRIALFPPNVFTPQANQNELFRPVALGVVDYEIWIYDRRGKLVFHSTDITTGWDGTHNGKPCPQATYAYKCRYREVTTPLGDQMLHGTVTLLR